MQAQGWYLAEKGAAKTGGPGAAGARRGRKFMVSSRSADTGKRARQFRALLCGKGDSTNAVFNDFFDNEVGFVFLLLPYFLMLGGTLGRIGRRSWQSALCLRSIVRIGVRRFAK